MASESKKSFVEQGLQLTLLLSLLYWCLVILSPFVLLLLWSIIISVTLFPLQHLLVTRYGWKSKWGAVVITFLLLVVFVVPIGLVVEAVIYELDFLIGEA